MTRSRLRKLRRVHKTPHRSIGPVTLPIAGALLSCWSSVQGQQRTETGALEELIVTATKRSESLQNVPLSVQALGATALEDLNVVNFADYAKHLPGVTYQTYGPGFAKIYMRGVSSGDIANHAGSLPSVGMYLDEQPITTIQGPLDIHIYDIERVESLAGPQGTLYGASSEAGTIRIITKKPEIGAFRAGYDLRANSVAHGDLGGSAEGFVNLPLGEAAAVRLVGWRDHAAGFIDNVAGSSLFPAATSVVNGTERPPWALSNAPYAKKHYNTVDTSGGRAALKWAIGDAWTVTPVFQGQHTKSRGMFARDVTLGDLQVQHFGPEWADDRWTQIALTLEGKISDYDLVYSAGYISRHDESHIDYTDYALAYSVSSGLGDYNLDNAGNPLQTTQHESLRDTYRMQSQELRISSPREDRFRFVAGLYLARQSHHLEAAFNAIGVNGDPDLGSYYSVTNWPGAFWLTNDQRVNRDAAAFTELSFDLTPKLTLMAGVRFFRAETSLEGFYGYGVNNSFTSHTGELDCVQNNFPGGAHFPGIFGNYCNNMHTGGVRWDNASGGWLNTGQPYENGVSTRETGHTPKVNIAYRFSNEKLGYVTYSKGFRPGGVNRIGYLPYSADYLSNYELGWKTTWMQGRLRFNGAFFLEDWKQFQFSFVGPNNVYAVANAPKARIKGAEATMDWAATDQLVLSGGFSFTDARLSADWTGGCGDVPCDPPLAPKGQMLPNTPRWKADATARYSVAIGSVQAYAQGSVGYQSYVWADMRTAERELLGRQSSFATTDISTGIVHNGIKVELSVTNLFDKRQDLYRYAQCATATCASPNIPGYAPHVYSGPGQPRTLGIKFSQKF